MFRKVNKIDNYYKIDNKLFNKYIVIKLRRKQINNMESEKVKEIKKALEKEIEENAFYSKGYAQGIKNTYEVIVPDKLKQFAERLRKRIADTMYSREGYVDYDDTMEVIDETLKVYDKWKNIRRTD